MILAFYNIAIFDKYFGVFGSDLQASPPVYLTIQYPPPWAKKTTEWAQYERCTSSFASQNRFYESVRTCMMKIVENTNRSKYMVKTPHLIF